MGKFTKEERLHLESVITLKKVKGRMQIDTVIGDVECIKGNVRKVIGSVQTVTREVGIVGSLGDVLIKGINNG